jgi:hypothetical protein
MNVMQRRTYLLTAGTTTMALLAGCSGSSDETGGDGGEESNTDESGSDSKNDSSSDDSGGDGESEGESEDEGNPAEEAAKGEDVLENAGLVIQEHELVVEDEFNAYIEGIVENTTDKTKDYVEVRVRGYDSDGNQLDSYFTNTTDLQGGGTWAFEVMILDPEDIDEYDIQVTDSPF